MNEMSWDEWFALLCEELDKYDICGWDEPWQVLKDLYEAGDHPEDAAYTIYMES